MFHKDAELCRTMQNSKTEILKDRQENFSSYSTVADVSVAFLCCDRGSPEGSLAILAMSMRSSTWKHPIIHRNLWNVSHSDDRVILVMIRDAKIDGMVS